MSKPLIWMHGEIKTPPFSSLARIEVGMLLRRLQEEELLSMPRSRPMPSIGPNCHELRVKDEHRDWRILYRIEPDAIVILEVFQKSTQQTPKQVIDNCQRRLAKYLVVAAEDRRATDAKKRKKEEK